MQSSRTSISTTRQCCLNGKPRDTSSARREGKRNLKSRRLRRRRRRRRDSFEVAWGSPRESVRKRAEREGPSCNSPDREVGVISPDKQCGPNDRHGSRVHAGPSDLLLTQPFLTTTSRSWLLHN